jgi:transcription elongation factor GreA
MSEQTVYLTREGYEKLQSELDYLRKVRRQEVARRLHDALAEGDLLENAELEAARNEQAFVEGRILELERMLGSAEIIEAAQSGEVVSLGSRVTIVEDNYPPETYHIIDSAEADPSEGKISFKSPLGRALMGRRVGDEVRVNAPDGVIVFHVVEIH